MLYWSHVISSALRTTLPTFLRTSSSGCSEPMSAITRKLHRWPRARKDANSRTPRGREGCVPSTRAALSPDRGSWRAFARYVRPIRCSNVMSQKIRVFATCDIGDALNILREKLYDLE